MHMNINAQAVKWEVVWTSISTHRGTEGQFTATLCWNGVLKVEGVMMDDPPSASNERTFLWGRSCCSNSLRPLEGGEMTRGGDRRGSRIRGKEGALLETGGDRRWGMGRPRDRKGERRMEIKVLGELWLKIPSPLNCIRREYEWTVVLLGLHRPHRDGGYLLAFHWLKQMTEALIAHLSGRPCRTLHVEVPLGKILDWCCVISVQMWIIRNPGCAAVSATSVQIRTNGWTWLVL